MVEDQHREVNKEEAHELLVDLLGELVTVQAGSARRPRIMKILDLL